MTNKIDFVVLWVDPNDEEWQKSRDKFAKQLDNTNGIDNNNARYRDWGNFKYWFRGVEKFAPWVNKVHLVTNGQIPKWLNINHPKLNLVKHSDFMPKSVLPTFNTNAIELCLHKIPDLSEQFVLFNDDVFLTKKVKPTDFFRKGKPANTMALFAIRPVEKGKNRSAFYQIVAKDIAVINRNFNFNKVKIKNLGKFLSLKQGMWVLFTYPLLAYGHFVGFRNFHICNSYLKHTYIDVWKKEPEVIEKTIKNRFRNNSEDVSDWLINYWQFATGNFCQRRANFGVSKDIDDPKVLKYITKQKYHVLCLNDSENLENCSPIEETTIKENINRCFNKILSKKSEYEL